MNHIYLISFYNKKSEDIFDSRPTAKGAGLDTIDGNIFFLFETEHRNEVNLRLTRRSGSAGVTGSSYCSIALLALSEH